MSFPENLLPELLLELSKEQQETVTGGANYTEITEETYEYSEHQTDSQTEPTQENKDPYSPSTYKRPFVSFRPMLGSHFF